MSKEFADTADGSEAAPGPEGETRLDAWLCCEPRPAVPLGPKPVVTIGRNKDCDLVLNDGSVSRLQATVLVDADTGKLMFKDGDSSNGSLLNGEPADLAELKHGDVLTFGQFEVRVQAVVAWACSDPMPPLPLGGQPAVTIGRSKECDLVIRNPGMSRRQGVIRIKGKSMVYEDGGSSNGSYLNGKRVQGMAPLHTGDVLTYGPYEVHLRSNEDMQRMGEALDHEGTIELSAIMTGLLAETSLSQTLQELAFNRKSGTLTLISGQAKGQMIFQNGEPLTASFADQSSDEAALSMLALLEGRYTFAAGEPQGVERSITCTMTSLLLQASRIRDEQNRA